MVEWLLPALSAKATRAFRGVNRRFCQLVNDNPNYVNKEGASVEISFGPSYIRLNEHAHPKRHTVYALGIQTETLNFKEMGVDFSMEKNKQGNIVFANCAPPPRRRTDDDETCETINAIFTKILKQVKVKSVKFHEVSDHLMQHFVYVLSEMQHPPGRRDLVSRNLEEVFFQHSKFSRDTVRVLVAGAPRLKGLKVWGEITMDRKPPLRLDGEFFKALPSSLKKLELRDVGSSISLDRVLTFKHLESLEVDDNFDIHDANFLFHRVLSDDNPLKRIGLKVDDERPDAEVFGDFVRGSPSPLACGRRETLRLDDGRRFTVSFCKFDDDVRIRMEKMEH